MKNKSLVFRVHFFIYDIKEIFSILPSIDYYHCDTLLVFTWLIFEIDIIKEEKNES